MAYLNSKKASTNYREELACVSQCVLALTTLPTNYLVFLDQHEKDQSEYGNEVFPLSKASDPSPNPSSKKNIVHQRYFSMAVGLLDREQQKMQ